VHSSVVKDFIKATLLVVVVPGHWNAESKGFWQTLKTNSWFNPV